MLKLIKVQQLEVNVYKNPPWKFQCALNTPSYLYFPIKLTSYCLRMPTNCLGSSMELTTSIFYWELDILIRTIQISEILTLLFVNISCGAGRRLQRASGQSEHNWLFGKGALKRQALKKISCIKGQYKINKELFEL